MKLLFLSLVVLCLVFAISCTSDSSGNGEEKYGYCVSVEEKICLSGGFTECATGFNLSNNCPYNYSSSLEEQSSSSGSELSSSSLEEQSSSSSIVFGSVEHGGQTYKTVVIGEQTWMAENLNYETESGSYCYNNLNSNCDKYGRLYKWATAMAGICPAGYHIPSNDDWDKLIRYVDEQNDGGGSGNPYSSMTAGIYLKSKEGWKNCGSIGTETYECLDAYGFAALPGGHYSDGDFGTIEYIGNWWSTSEANGQSSAYFRSLNYNNGNAYCYVNPKTNAYSVRCVKD